MVLKALGVFEDAKLARSGGRNNRALTSAFESG